MGVPNVVVTSSQTADKKTPWTITTMDGTYTAIDKNGNHRLDDGELQAALNSTGNALSTENYTKARLQIAMQNNPTTAEMAQYEQFNSYLDAQSAKQAQEEASTKKKGFWGKVGNFFKGVGKGIGSFFKNIGSLIGPIGMGLMAFGGFRSMMGTGDWASNMNMTMAGGCMAAVGAMNQYTQTLNAMTLAGAGGTTFDVSSIGSGINEGTMAMLKGLDYTNGFGMGDGSTLNTDGTNSQKSTISSLKNLYNRSSRLNGANDGNLAWIKENIIDKEAEELDDADLEIAKQILQNPTISYQVIGNGENQITLQDANTIPVIIREYKAAKEDNKLKIMSNEDHAKFNQLISKATLTSEEASELTRIIAESSENIKNLAA